MRVIKVTAPAHWASYLINGDASIWDYYYDPEDEAACLAMEQELGSPVACEDIGFCWNPDYGEPGECCEYTFLVRDDTEKDRAI